MKVHSVVKSDDDIEQPTSLVAGGAGFIGSHLCDYLIKRGHNVICMDNFSTGKVANIVPTSRDDFSLFKCGVDEPFKILGEIDYIYHLASPASPVAYGNMPIETMRCGSIGTMNLIELAREKGAGFLFASTSEVYGDALVNPQPETYWGNVNPIGARSMYDEAKRFGEAITMAYHTSYYTYLSDIGFTTRIARIFNTYGPRMNVDDGRAIPNFVNQALRGEPLTVYGDGTQTRSFCYVSDTVKGLYKLMMSSYQQPVNIGNPNEMPMLKLADLVLEMTESKSNVVHERLPSDDPKVRCPDIRTACCELDWEPTVTLYDGLKSTIDYFKSIGVTNDV
jgi:dTDP-glucose 4,6-dehydratase